MNDFCVISINGRSYQCKNVSASIDNTIDIECVGLLKPKSIDININKALPVSGFYSDSGTYIASKYSNGEVVTIEFDGDDCALTGSFYLTKLKQHKKGAVSFSASSSGVVTIYKEGKVNE